MFSFKKKNSLGGKVTPSLSVAAASGGGGPRGSKKKRSGKSGAKVKMKSVGVLPARTTSVVAFNSVLPPNLLSKAYFKSRRDVFRPDYVALLFSLLIGAAALVYFGLRVEKTIVFTGKANALALQASAASAQRHKMQTQISSMQTKMSADQRLFEPAQSPFSLADFLFTAGTSLPKQFFVAGVSGEFSPHFYVRGHAVSATSKSFSQVDAFAAVYTFTFKVQGLDVAGTSRRLSPFLQDFSPPLVISSSSGGSDEGASFILSYTRAPLFLFTPPSGGNLSRLLGNSAQPVVPHVTHLFTH